MSLVTAAARMASSAAAGGSGGGRAILLRVSSSFNGGGTRAARGHSTDGAVAAEDVENRVKSAHQVRYYYHGAR